MLIGVNLPHQEVVNLVVMPPVWDMPCPPSGWFVGAQGICRY